MNGVSDIVKLHLDREDWAALRIVGAGTASGVPTVLCDLLNATSEADAEEAYWKLDNRIVVQGQLFDAAPKLVPTLLAAASGSLNNATRPFVLDLLVEILCGESDQSEVEQGNARLGPEARRAAREGVWLAYRLVANAEASVRERAVFIVHAIDPDRERVARLLEAVTGDPDSRVRGFAVELQSRQAPGL